MFRLDAAAAIADLHRIDGQATASIRQALGQSVALALQLAKTTSTFKNQTGNLRSSMKRGQRGPWSFFVSAGDRSAPYAKFVEDDTKQHDIRPKRTGAVSSRRSSSKSMPRLLAFTVAGKMVFARKVTIPARSGSHFMLNARDQSEGALHRFVETGLNSAFT